MKRFIKWITLMAVKLAVVFAVGIVAGLLCKHLFNSPNDNFPDSDAFAKEFARAVLEKNFPLARSMAYDGDVADMYAFEDQYMQGWTNFQAKLDAKYFRGGWRTAAEIDKALGSMQDPFRIGFYNGKPVIRYDLHLGLSDDPEGDWHIVLTSEKGKLKVVKQIF